MVNHFQSMFQLHMLQLEMMMQHYHILQNKELDILRQSYKYNQMGKGLCSY
jgi:hypothetical protein